VHGAAVEQGAGVVFARADLGVRLRQRVRRAYEQRERAERTQRTQRTYDEGQRVR